MPEINPGHLGLLAVQRRERGWEGAIVTNPNCAAVVLVIPLAALRRFGIRKVVVTTFQAVSGAGYPGVPSLDILGNVIPYIGGDEEKKVESETQKILGELDGDRIRPLPFTVSASCNRVPSVDGHLVSASVEFERRPEREEILAALAAFSGLPQERGLPSAPKRPIHLWTASDRPQPRKDAGLGARHGHRRRPAARVQPLPLEVRRALPQRAARRGRRGAAQRRDDEERGAARPR